MSQDRQRFGEPTIQEMVADPIVIALMRSDNVEPEALERLLHVAESPFVLRSEARRLRGMAKATVDIDSKQKLAAQALDLAQRAEVIARWQENPESLRPSIDRFRARLVAGIDDPSLRKIVEQILRNAEQLAARLSNPQQPFSTGKTTTLIGPNTSTERKRSREGNSRHLSEPSTASNAAKYAKTLTLT
jgi:hypothetical protein